MITHSLADAVSLRRSVRLITVSFRMPSFTVPYLWSSFTLYYRQSFRDGDGRTRGRLVPSPLFKIFPSPSSAISPVTIVHLFYPHHLPPTPYLRQFIYWRVMELIFQRGRNIVRMDVYLMLWTCGSFLLALLLTRRCFVFRAFFLIYK